MISASNNFLALVSNGSIPSIRVLLTLADETTIWIENDDIWSDSVSFSEATSSDGSFDVGAAVIGEFNFTINNFSGNYTNTDFRGSIVTPYIYYTINGTPEYVQRGVYYVVSHKTRGNIINVTSMDALKLFDSTDTPITYPTTVQSLVETICTSNGITLGTVTIPNGTFALQSPQISENEYYTDRQKLSYACQCIGCYAKIDENGELIIDWYNLLSPVVISSTFDGKTLSTDTFTVTGIRFSISTDTETTDYLYGTDDVVIKVSGNPFINADNLATVCTNISTNIFNKTFRSGTVPILANPCLQAGDVVQITDNVTGSTYVMPVTGLTYTKSLIQNVECAFEDKEHDDLRPSSEYRLRTAIESATSQAQTAQATADAVQITANAALTIAENTDQYFWFTSTGADTGAHITDITKDEFLEDPSNGGGNLLARSNGIAVRNGLTELSTFGVNGICIGRQNRAHTELNNTSWMMYDSDGNMFAEISDVRDGQFSQIYEFSVTTSLAKTEWQTNPPSGTTEISSFIVNGIETSFTSTIVDGYITEIQFTTEESVETINCKMYFLGSLQYGDAKAYTFGYRDTSDEVGAMSISTGYQTTASGFASFAEGYASTAAGMCSHAEGGEFNGTYSLGGSYAGGISSHAEGFSSATGYASHSEGRGYARDLYAHAEGTGDASNSYTHAQNESTKASKRSQTAIGTYNVEDTSATTTHPSQTADYGEHAFIVGNGTSSSNRSNAFTVDWDGRIQSDTGFDTSVESLTVTRTTNNYCDATAVGRLKAYKKCGMLFLNGNLGLTNAIPTSTADTQIATITGWSACSYVYQMAAARNGTGTIGVFVTSDGAIKIHNYSGSSVTGWVRFFACVPMAD